MGGSILLTRSPVEESQLCGQLKHAGYRVFQWPGIELSPEPLAGGEGALLGAFSAADAVVFPSPGAVGCAWQQWPQLHEVIEAGAVQVYGQGPGTAAALRAQGLQDIVIPERRDATGLATRILADWTSEARILLLVGDLSGDVLPRRLEEKGLGVERLVIYRNRAPDHLQRPQIPLDCVVFGSPSAARNHLEQNPWLHVVPAVAYGQTTARWLKENSEIPRVEVADQPTGEAVYQAIERMMRGTM